jgi:hypothetical protein
MQANSIIVGCCPLRLVAVRTVAFDLLFDLATNGCPLLMQRRDHDRIDDHHDLVAVCVMRAELLALVRV